MDTSHQGEELISFAQDEVARPAAAPTTTTTTTMDTVPPLIPMTSTTATIESPSILPPLVSPQKRRMGAHSRSYSWVAPPSPRKNGPSFSFPVSIASLPINHARTPSSASISSPISPFAPVDAIEPSIDPERFLTVLASQERRVLELREELTKADAELEKLKRKWALHEATRKRTENNAAGQAKNSSRKSEDVPSSSREARRKSAGTGITGHPRRTTTFSSNTRHQRTLSLLSPDRNNFHSFPQPADLWTEPSTPAKDSADSVPRSLPTNPLENTHVKTGYSDFEALDNQKRAGHQDALIATGKQMAEDFKEGLWTFIEDLRQATVGEEGSQGPEAAKASQSVSTNATPLKKTTSKNNLKSTNGTTPSAKAAASRVKPSRSKSTVKATKLIDIGDDFWNELDPNGPLSADGQKHDSVDTFAEEMRSIKKSHVKPESTRWSSSTILSDMASGAMTPDTSISTPRTSTSSFSRSRSNSPSRKDSAGGLSSDRQQKTTAELLQSLADAHAQQQSASWGAVVNPLGFNIKKTATAFLSQVEKSLAPPMPPQTAVNTFDTPRIAQSTPSKSKNH